MTWESWLKVPCIGEEETVGQAAAWRAEGRTCALVLGERAMSTRNLPRDVDEALVQEPGVQGRRPG